mgnify:FL=1|jgi:transposase
MNDVTLIGIDTAKSIFHFHAVNKNGKQIYQKALRRPKLLEFLANSPQAVIAIEGCSSCHHWSRKFSALGHSVKIISARKAAQFRSRNKNDYNDAKALTKAARDEDTYFIPAKSSQQQTIQAIHKIRDFTMRQRTATVNTIRALLTEFGIVFPLGVSRLRLMLPNIIDDLENELPQAVRDLLNEQYALFKQLSDQIKSCEKRLQCCLKDSPQAQQLKQIPGVGLIISTALTYMIPDPSIFKNGRNCAAWLGLTPKEHSSGGKQRLGGISCEGNAYLRKILVQGAQAMLQRAHKRQDPLSIWASRLKAKKGTNLAAVALANKITRIAWAILHQQTDFNYKPKFKKMNTN